MKMDCIDKSIKLSHQSFACPVFNLFEKYYPKLADNDCNQSIDISALVMSTL